MLKKRLQQNGMPRTYGTVATMDLNDDRGILFAFKQTSQTFKTFEFFRTWKKNVQTFRTVSFY